MSQRENDHKTEERTEETVLMEMTNCSVVGGNVHQPYDPHEHRASKSPTTDGESIILLLKGCIGTGILSMPIAFSKTGLLVGVISTLLLGTLVTYCIHTLIKNQYEICKWLRVPVLSYPESMRVALEHGPPILKPFARISGPLVDFFLLMYQLGMCSVYIVFVSHNLKQILDHFWVLDLRLIILMLFIPLLLTCYIRNLKLLAPFSQAANVLMFLSLGTLMYFLLPNLPPISSRPLYGTPSGYVFFFSTTLFALSATGVMVSVERNMANPSSFRKTFGVLNISMTVVVLIYACLGFFGFLKYGNDVKGSISLNLPQDGMLSQVVKFSFSMSILLTFSLQFYVAIEILCSTYLKNMMEESNKPVMFEYGLRTVLVICVFCASLVIPMLEQFISLIGALCLSSIGILFPPIMEICVLYSQNRLNCLNTIKNLIVVFIGLMGLFIGTYLSIVDIIEKLKET